MNEICKECTLNKEPVLGSGCNYNPDIAIVGEAPGAEEVKRGEPFVGKSGRLLRETLSILDFDLSKIYYTNACMCRPPNNRDPKSSEIRACNQRLVDELERVNPSLVITMGNAGTISLLGPGPGITKRRGMCREAHGFKILPTIHPAGILRSPDTYPDFISDLKRAKYLLDGGKAVIEPSYHNYRLIETQRDFETFMAKLLHAGKCAVDLETTSLDFQNGRILSIGFSYCTGFAYVVDWHKLINGSLNNWSLLNSVLSNVDCYFHNGQFDVLWLKFRGINPRYTRDTMLMHYLLDERQGVHSLKRLAIDRYFAPNYGEGIIPDGGLTVELWDSDAKVKIAKYNGADADYTWRLANDLWNELAEEDLCGIHDNILIPAAKHFIEFEISGMLVDLNYFESLGKKWDGEIADIESKLRNFPGAENINLSSPKQVSEYMFNVLELKPVSGDPDEVVDQSVLLRAIKSTEDPEAQEYWRSSGAASARIKPHSTSVYMLYYLAQQHDFPRMLIEYRLAARTRSMYYDGYKKMINSDCRIRPNYKLHGTRTGRLSTSNPNIHGMIKRKEIKSIFIADPGWSILYADYSQAEIRMLAHFAKDDKLISILKESDIHRAVMRELFEIGEDEISELSKDEYDRKRRAAKNCNFGMIYGISAKSLALQLGVSADEAQEYKNKLISIMPGVSAWIKQQHRRVVRDHEVISLYGRKRRFSLIPQGGLGEVKRQAVNTPIQSSVSDMNLLAHIRIVERLKVIGIPVKVWPNIHDSVMVQVPDDLVKPATKIMIEEMHDVGFATEVPFVVEVSTGKGWGDLKVIYEG